MHEANVKVALDDTDRRATSRERVERKRIQVYFSSRSIEKLRRIRSCADYASDNEALRDAVDLLDLAVTWKKKGYKVQLVRDRKVTSVEMFIPGT